MAKGNEAVKKWREQLKIRMVQSMGGKCCVCGYNKTNKALAFHHLDPSKKELSFGKIMANPQKWETIVIELRKCILVCHNCHAEIHAFVTKIPDNPPKFDESFAIKNKTDDSSPCEVCGSPKPMVNKTCSRKCAATIRQIVEYSLEDIKEVVCGNISAARIGEKYGVTSAAIIKRIKKLGMYEEFKTNYKKKISEVKNCGICGKSLFSTTKGNMCRACIDGHTR